METCRLTSSHLRLGVPLPGHVYDANGQLLLSKNQVVDSQQQLDRLLARGLYVEMAVFEAHYSRPASTPAQAPDEGKRFDPFLVRNTLRLGLGRLLHSALAGAASRTQIVDFAASVEACVDTDADGDWVDLPGATGTTLVVSGTEALHGARYRAVATSTRGTATSGL